MAIAVVQSASAAYSLATTFNIVFSGASTPGNGIIVAYFCSTTTTTAAKMTDNQNNYYYFAFRKVGSFANTEYWYCPKVTASSIITITVTNSVSGIGGAIAREYSGFINGIAPDKIASASGASAAPASATAGITTGVPGVAIGVVAQIGTAPVFSLGSGYNNLTLLTGGSNRFALEDQLINTNAALAASFGSTISGNWDCGVGTFKDANGPTVINNYQALKVGDGMSVSERIR